MDDGRASEIASLADGADGRVPRSRGTAVFIGAIGVPLVAFGMRSAGRLVGAPAGASLLFITTSAFGIIMGYGLGFVFLRIAVRLWRVGAVP